MYVAFFKGKGGWLDFCIRKITKAKYTHVEFLVSAKLENGKIVKGSCISSSPYENGVRMKTVEFADGEWDFLKAPELRLKDEFGLAQRAVIWYSEHKKCKYDWSGALGIAFKPVSEDKNRWFCSEAVADIIGLDDPWRYDPQTLYSTIEGINNK